jgi:hypothetical protein
MAEGKVEVSGVSRCGRERVITDVSNNRSVSIFRVMQSEELEQLSVRRYIISHTLVPIHSIVTVYGLHDSKPSNHN